MNVGISERIGVFFEKGSKLKKERNSGFSLCHSFYDILEASSFNDGKTEIDKEEEEMEKTRLWRFS